MSSLTIKELLRNYFAKIICTGLQALILGTIAPWGRGTLKTEMKSTRKKLVFSNFEWNVHFRKGAGGHSKGAASSFFQAFEGPSLCRIFWTVTALCVTDRLTSGSQVHVFVGFSCFTFSWSRFFAPTRIHYSLCNKGGDDIGINPTKTDFEKVYAFCNRLSLLFLFQWRLPEDKPIPIVWLLTYVVAMTVNIASLTKDGSQRCVSDPCIIFYVLGSAGALLGLAFFYRWLKKTVRYFARWIALNQEWTLVGPIDLRNQLGEANLAYSSKSLSETETRQEQIAWLLKIV